MGRRDERGLRPTDADLAAAEAATRAMLADYDEPQPLAPPPDLAARVLAALPTTAHPSQARTWPRMGFGMTLATALLLLLALGGWGLYGGLLALRADGGLIADQVPGSSSLTASLATILSRVIVGQPTAPPPVLIVGLLSLATLAFSSAVAIVWPRRTRGVALALRQTPTRALALGLLATLLAGLSLLLLAALAQLFLAWLALLLPLALLLQLPYLLGLAALGDALSRAAGLRLTTPASSTLGTAGLLLLLAPLGVGAPLLSVGLFYLGAGLGLGAAILSRGGAYTPL